MYWSKTEGGRVISFDYIPFSIAEVKLLDCQFGEKYYKQQPPKGKRLWLQGSRKHGCAAHVTVKSYILYPSYGINKEDKALSKWKLRCLCAQKLNELREDLAAKKEIKMEKKYYVSFPSEAAHSEHPTGQSSPAIYSQKVHPKVASKIVDMVQSGITDSTEVKRSLKCYVDTILAVELGQKPQLYDRAFYPSSADIRNHIYMARKVMDLSKFDQENLQLKIDKWKAARPMSSFYFRPYQSVDSDSSALANQSSNVMPPAEQTILYVHQEDWQKDLLVRYGNLMTLMDATYKTTKYSVPLFFLCVKTNVSYSVVAEFIVQSENAENISEALSVISSWNPKWQPRFFLTDYSDAEMGAVEQVFKATQLYLCDFHREQAWERWVKESSHGLTEDEASNLLELLRNCANAPPNRAVPEQPVDCYFKNEMKRLKESQVWLQNERVRTWVSSTWLSCCEVRAYLHDIIIRHLSTLN